MKLDDTMFSLDIPLIVQHLALHILSSLPSFLLGGRWPQSKTYEVTDLSVCKLYRERSDEERESLDGCKKDRRQPSEMWILARRRKKQAHIVYEEYAPSAQ